MSGHLPDDWGAVEAALAGDEALVRSLASLLERASDADPSRFAGFVDSSDHSPRDWVEALAAFDAWLAAKGASQRPFEAMCGYLHCCASLNPATIPTASLKVIAIEALTEFGFDVLSDCQT